MAPGRRVAGSGGRVVGTLLCAGMLVGLTTATGASAATSAWSAHGSAEQVYVLGLPAGAQAELLDANGQVVPSQNPEGQTVASQRADSLGGLLFRQVPPGTGYRVLDMASGQESGPVTVHSDQAAPWDPGIYDQTIKDRGYQYLTTRDGTKLAIYVHPPTSPAGVTEGLPTGQSLQVGLPDGTYVPPGPDYAPPYPTLIEYSGYGYADPAGPENGIAALANLMGFAVVDVNMRGTGCSGGAFNFFEPLQSLDGYDV
ncbi:MAG TPA: CocE/NonD family hydrolase, partial [Acidimicrobiales bacterium]|nr:CocE/NonD family hydrolase [Acidimicrobiales bacterium]